MFTGAAEQSPPLRIYGDWLPGAMLFGETLPGAKVTVLERELVADDEGGFVFGLGRDLKGAVDIQLALAGKVRTQSFPVQARQYSIQRIEGVDKKYVSPPPEVTARIKAEAGRIWRARQTDSQHTFFRQTFKRPAQGPITGVYGSQRVFNGVPKRPHYGLDIAGPVGTPIVAPVDGVVMLAEADMYYSGGTLILDHGRGISSTFIHLSEILVSEGQQVKQGDLLAKMGATGRVTGPHLDWRVNWFNQRLDPALLLPELANSEQ